MIDRPFISQFSPQRTDPEALEQILVQRHDLLAENVERVRESVLTKNKHHLLFIGPRGAGKTHLVTLIHHRLRQQADLQDKLCFAWLNEDEIATTFLKLLILIYRDLSQRYPVDFPEKDLQNIYGMKPEVAQETLGKSLLKSLGKRTLVVIMENLDALFKEMPHKEQLNWRSFIQNHPVFATVGTAQSLFDEVADREKPFFGFFNTQHLEPLSVTEAILLLKNIAKLNGRDELRDFLDTPTGHARVQAIHDLAGGNPRIYIIFSDFLTRESLDDLVRPFEETADRQLTSYYQERLRWLSAQQREIVQYLCHQRHPVPVKQIAEGLFASHNTITNQLKQLRELRYVRGNERGREVLYELAEPLMRLALQVKETHDRQPLRLIVDFLRVWYDRGDIEERLDKLAPGTTGREYFEAALALLDSDEPNLRHMLLRRSLDNIKDENYDETSIATLYCLADETNSTKDWLKLGKLLLSRRKHGDAIAALRKAMKCPDKGEPSTTDILLTLGKCHNMIKEKAEAIRNFSLVIATDRAPINLLASALVQRGMIYTDMLEQEKALDDFNSAIELPGISDADLGHALQARGFYWQFNKKNELSIKDLTQAINLTNPNPHDFAIALLNRGAIFAQNKDYDQSIFDYTKVIQTKNVDKLLLNTALFQRAIIFTRNNQSDSALQDLRTALNSPVLGGLYGPFVSGLHAPGAVVVAISSKIANQASLQMLVGEFLRYFSKLQILSNFGEALIEKLPQVIIASLSHEAYDAWADAWTTGVQTLSPKDQRQMEIPLRLLRAGIEYYKTKDESTLLSLASEERKILRSVLKLDPDA